MKRLLIIGLDLAYLSFIIINGLFYKYYKINDNGFIEKN